MVPEQLRVPDGLSLGPVVLHIFPEHLAHSGHIRAAPAQERGRLKGTHAGLVIKLLVFES